MEKKILNKFFREIDDMYYFISRIFLQMMSKRRSFRFSNPWFESWSRNTRQHVRKGIKFGGSYDPQKNKDLFQRYNYKGMHLPFEVGFFVENNFSGVPFCSFFSDCFKVM